MVLTKVKINLQLKQVGIQESKFEKYCNFFFSFSWKYSLLSNEEPRELSIFPLYQIMSLSYLVISGHLMGNVALCIIISSFSYKRFTLSLIFLTGIAASFAVKLFKAWMAEKDANSVTSSLRKANLDKRLLVSVIWAKGYMFHASAMALSVCAT